MRFAASVRLYVMYAGKRLVSFLFVLSVSGQLGAPPKNRPSDLGGAGAAFYGTLCLSVSSAGQQQTDQDTADLT